MTHDAMKTLFDVVPVKHKRNKSFFDMREDILKVVEEIEHMLDLSPIDRDRAEVA